MDITRIRRADNMLDRIANQRVLYSLARAIPSNTAAKYLAETTTELADNTTALHLPTSFTEPTRQRTQDRL